MDARIWHAQATTAPASMPSPLTAEQCRALTSNERRRYVHDLQASFERLLLPRAQTEPVQSGMDRILRKNARQRRGAKRMIMLMRPSPPARARWSRTGRRAGTATGWATNSAAICRRGGPSRG